MSEWLDSTPSEWMFRAALPLFQESPELATCNSKSFRSKQVPFLPNSRFNLKAYDPCKPSVLDRPFSLKRVSYVLPFDWC